MQLKLSVGPSALLMVSNLQGPADAFDTRGVAQRRAGSEQNSPSGAWQLWFEFGVFTSTSSRRLDGGDVDLLHRHHRREGTLGLTATSRQRIG